MACDEWFIKWRDWGKPDNISGRIAQALIRKVHLSIINQTSYPFSLQPTHKELDTAEKIRMIL